MRSISAARRTLLGRLAQSRLAAWSHRGLAPSIPNLLAPSAAPSGMGK